MATVITFNGMNGRRLTLTNDAACHLVTGVAEGQMDSVDDIAARLRTATGPGVSGCSGRGDRRVRSTESKQGAGVRARSRGVATLFLSAVACFKWRPPDLIWGGAD